MAKTDEKVMNLVENELEKNPDISVEDLYEKAKANSPSVGELTLRQFNARYPLQVKRRRSRKKSPGPTQRRQSTTPKPAAKTRQKKQPEPEVESGERERVRKTFLRFASDLAAAEERKELVDVVASVDEYVDQVLNADGR